MFEKPLLGRAFRGIVPGLDIAFGMAMDTITGFVTAPGATLTAQTAAAGDSFTVRNATPGKSILLLDAWAWNQAAGIWRVRSPKLTDNVQGLRFRVPGNSQSFPFFDEELPQILYAQDQLIFEQSGSAVGGQIESSSTMVWYEDIGGIAARLTTYDDVQKRGVELFTQEVSCVSAATGGYTGQAVLNSTFDLMKANTDYAVLGYLVDASCVTVCLRGADTGNLRVAGPGNQLLRDVTRYWFRNLSESLGRPAIPIINSANKANTFCDVVASQAAGTFNINWLMMELAPTA